MGEEQTRHSRKPSLGRLREPSDLIPWLGEGETFCGDLHGRERRSRVDSKREVAPGCPGAEEVDLNWRRVESRSSVSRFQSAGPGEGIICEIGQFHRGA